MKYPQLFTLFIITLLTACQDDIITTQQTENTEYVKDDLFGCSQFETMITDETFFNNAATPLETFQDFFVYAGTEDLVVRDGFNGAILQKVALSVNNLAVFDNQLMVCAEEGFYSLDEEGVLSNISEDRCNTMIIDGQGRLLLQGEFGAPQMLTTFQIQEFEDGMITPFAPLASSVTCVSMELIAGAGSSFYALSCNNEISYYEDDVLVAEYRPDEAPFLGNFFRPFLTAYHDGGLLAIVQSSLNLFGIHKLSSDGWTPLYDLVHENTDTEKQQEIFLHLEDNVLVHNDYLYGFSVGDVMRGNGIIRYALSGEEPKSVDDVDLIEMEGLSSRDIIHIVKTSDGSAYAVMNSGAIVKLSC
ncbi:MAG: hypothetical protein AAGJ93_07090 [Bacteroidota bacterium]